jgi:hypothetical protein
MNIEFFDEFQRVNPTLPLKKAGNITCANATRINWEEVCPKEQDDEIYILGNPPYLGGKLQSSLQKEDMATVFSGFKKFNNIDYIGCWFFKTSKYTTDKIQSAFVTTNSISQGTQVSDLWPFIFDLNIEIGFAVKDFIWSNNAKNKANVICSIISIRGLNIKKGKYMYSNGISKKVKNINAYLLDAPNVFVKKRTAPLSFLPKMIQGNIPLENGYLRMDSIEKNKIVDKYPESEELFRNVFGSSELIQGKEYHCLWLNNNNLNQALTIPPIKERIERVYDFRKNGATNAVSCMNRSHEFCMTNTANNNQLVIPIVSSIRREYIPISYVNKNDIVINSALIIDSSEVYIFALINSKIHIKWVKSFSGKLKSDFRYSVGLCWYSFPFPEINQKQKEELTQCAFQILSEREKYPEKTLAQLYDPDKMPDGLREAHHQNDLAIERCYRSKPFENDEERLEYLFKLYEKMIAKEETK